MKGSGFFTLFMALLMGLAAFLLARSVHNYDHVRHFDEKIAQLEHDTRANLAWMRSTLALTDLEFAQECALHESHMAECRRLNAEMNVSRERLKLALQDSANPTPEDQAAIRDYELHVEACEHATLQHIQKVAAAMHPEAGKAYLKIMLPLVVPEHDLPLQAARP